MFLYYTCISSSILRPSCRYCVLASLRSYPHVHIFLSATSLLSSSIHRIPLLVSMCACFLRGRASTRASGNILFTPLCLSSLNSAARLSARFLFLFSLKSREPLGVSNGNRRLSTMGLVIIFVYFRLLLSLFFFS